MKKIILAFALLFTLCSFTKAQTAVERTKVFDNTSVSVVGGAATNLAFNSLFPVNGLAGLKAQKEVTDWLAFNAEGLAWFGDANFGNSHTTVKAISTTVNGQINLTSLFVGTNKKFNLSTETGLGALWQLGNHSGDDCDFIAKTGIVADYKISPAWSVFANPAIYWNLTGEANDHVQFNKNHAQLALLVGVTYHFKNHDSSRGFKYYDIAAMNSEINTLKAELAKKPKEVEVYIHDTTTVTNTIGNTVVFFARNSSELTAIGCSELSKIPEGSHVSIIGEASPEGSVENNQSLSEARAQIVASYLENNGVIVDSLVGIGSTNDASNRVVTIIIR